MLIVIYSYLMKYKFTNNILNIKSACIFLIHQVAGLNILAGRFWATRRMFDTPDLDQS